MKNTNEQIPRPGKERLRELLSFPETHFLYLCFHDAIAEKLRNKLEARTISTESCVTISEYPRTIYLGKDTVFGLRIAITKERIEMLAELLDEILTDEIFRFYCDFSLQDTPHRPYFTAIPHEDDYRLVKTEN